MPRPAALRRHGDVHQVPDLVVARADEVAEQLVAIGRRQADPRGLGELEHEHRQRPRRREGAALDRDHRGQVAVGEAPDRGRPGHLTRLAWKCLAHAIAPRRALSGRSARGARRPRPGTASARAQTCRAATRCTGSASSGTSTPRLASSSRNRTAPDPAASGNAGSSATRSASSPEAATSGSQSRSPLRASRARRRPRRGGRRARRGGRGSGPARSPSARPSASSVQTPVTGRPGARREPPRGCDADADPDEGARPRARPRSGSTASQPPAAATARSTSASSAVEWRGLPSGAEPEQLLVQHLAAAHRADGGVGGRRVEADDRHLAAAAVSQRC